MASKAALVNGDQRPAPNKVAPVKRQGPNAEPNLVDKTVGVWKEFTRFLSDVRGEMRKVVTPSRKEVEATTTVVIVAVFIFGLFFFVVDSIFAFGLDRLLKRLGGL
ncbi:MAG: preprotein translocase subunit SecE [Terracidiphilus sp.]|jgi:preprotein translocase subunit SecE